MKIVHVSNFTMKWNGENYFTIPYKLNNGLTRLGHNVFSVCDRDIADAYLLGIRGVGRRHANRKVLAICEEIRPDLVLLGHCTLITASTISSIRKNVPGVHIAHWNCDPLFFPENMARLKALAPLVDATFVTTAGPMLEEIANAGGRVAYMPNPVDSSLETLRAFENDRADIDLLFMGSPNKERAAICQAIRKAIPGLKFETRGFGGTPSVFGAKLFDLLGRSKMGLSLSRRDDIPLYASDRMSIMMGNGLLTFVDKRTGFDRLFGPEEVVIFEGVDDLIAKIRSMTQDETTRRHIARHGWEKIHEIFDGSRVAEWMIKVACAGTSAQIPEWLQQT